MNNRVRHILGISGGKDSAALSIYLKQKYPNLKIEYNNSDTGWELEETEALIGRLETYLGKYRQDLIFRRCFLSEETFGALM